MAKSNSQGARARSRARRLVLQGLYQWQLSGAPTPEIIAQLLADQNTRDTDTEYFEMLLRDAVTGCDALEQRYSAHLDRPAAQLDPVERSILLLATCELESRPEVPYRVVLNEAVELSKKFGAEDSYKYINAVLEKACAELRAAEFGRDSRRSRKP
jgi:N utilization substance protein B